MKDKDGNTDRRRDERTARHSVGKHSGRIWKIYPHIPVGRGKTLRSVRFLWDSDTLKEVSDVHQEIQDEEWYAIRGGSVRRRAKNRVPGRDSLSKMKALEWESIVKKSATMPKRLALYEVSALYLHKREGRCKKNTLIYKKSVLRKLNKFIGPKTEFSTITKNDLEAFLEAARVAVSAKSANKYRIEL